MDLDFTFEGELWCYVGAVSWHFVTLPEDIASEIRFFAQSAVESGGRSKRGFGSVKVTARVGGMKWQTSLFPDKRSGSFLLPIKKEVRSGEGLEIGKMVRVHLHVIFDL